MNVFNLKKGTSKIVEFGKEDLATQKIKIEWQFLDYLDSKSTNKTNVESVLKFQEEQKF